MTGHAAQDRVDPQFQRAACALILQLVQDIAQKRLGPAHPPILQILHWRNPDTVAKPHDKTRPRHPGLFCQKLRGPITFRLGVHG